MVWVVGRHLAHIHLEDTRRVVHWSSVESREGQDTGMSGLNAHGGLVFGAHRRLVADEVRIGAAESCGTHCLVGIDHDMVLRRLLNAIEVVVVDPLRIVGLASRHDISDIAGFHGGVVVAVHELIRGIEMALVVADRGRGLVVHNHLHSLFLGIVVDTLYIEVGIGCNEVIDIVFLIAEPVFPSDIPALNEHTIEAVLGGEIDIAEDILGGGAVVAVGRYLAVVGLADLHGGEVVGVRPRLAPVNHLPPYSDVFHGLNPRCVLYAARLVEVERHAVSKDLLCVGRYLYGSPRALARGLHVALHPLCVGREMGGEDEGGVVEVEVHAGVVDERRLVDSEPHAVVGMQQEGSLDAGLREAALTDISHAGSVAQATDST